MASAVEKARANVRGGRLSKGQVGKDVRRKEEIVTEEKKPKPWPRDATSQSGNRQLFYSFASLSSLCLP